MVFQTLSAWAGNLLDDIAELRGGGAADEGYDTEFIAEKNYRHLHTEARGAGVYLRCNLCGKEFNGSVERAFDHVSGHQAQVGDARDIDPFENGYRGAPVAEVDAPAREEYPKEPARI